MNFSRRIAPLLLALAFPAAAQVAAPDNWRKESFTFPLQFAPTIPYEGTEHVRLTDATRVDVGRIASSER